MIRTRGLHAHVQSVCPHVCCQVTSLRNTNIWKATGFRSIPASVQKYPRSVSCHVPRCPIPPQHNSHRMSIQRVATELRFPTTPLSETMSATSPSQWNVLHPLTLVPSAQRNETMLTSVTRDQSSRRRAMKAASSHKPNQCPAHKLQPKRVVLQRYCSHPLSSPCCSILSAIRTTTRCSPAFQFDVLPGQRSTSERIEGMLFSARSRPNDHHRALDARIHLDSARLDILLHSFWTFLSSSMGFDLRTAFTADVWPSLVVETASPGPLVYRSLSQVSHQDHQSLFIVVFRRQIAHVAVCANLLQ